MKKKTATIENKIKLNTSIMATGNVNSFKKLVDPIHWRNHGRDRLYPFKDWVEDGRYRAGKRISRSGGIHVFPSTGSRSAG